MGRGWRGSGLRVGRIWPVPGLSVSAGGRGEALEGAGAAPSPGDLLRGRPGCCGLVAIVVACLSLPSLGAGQGLPAPLAAPERAGWLQGSLGSPAVAVPGGGEERSSDGCFCGESLPPTGPGGLWVLLPWAGQPRTRCRTPGRTPGSLLPLLCLTQPRRFPRPTHLSSDCFWAYGPPRAGSVRGSHPGGYGRPRSKEPPVDGGVHIRCGSGGWNSQSGDDSLPSSLGEVVHSLPPCLPFLNSRLRPPLRAEKRKMLPVTPAFG